MNSQSTHYFPSNMRNNFIDGDFFESLFDFNFNYFFRPDLFAPLNQTQIAKRRCMTNQPTPTWDKWRGHPNWAMWKWPSMECKRTGKLGKYEDMFIQSEPSFLFASPLNLFTLIDFINRLNPSFSFTLVTHQADVTISKKGSTILYNQDLQPGVHPTRVVNLPPQINRWYAQNLNIKNDEFFVSLPIGVERKRWSDGYKHEVLNEMIQNKRNRREKKHLVYANYSTKNNPSKRNINLKNIDCFFRTKPKNWPAGGWGCPFPMYANDIIDSIYVLCPAGYGLDTHRAWESLYLGAYPIVENNYMNQAIFKDLPAILVDDLNKLTNKLLVSKIEEMKSKEKNTEKLTQEYYVELIFGSKPK